MNKEVYSPSSSLEEGYVFRYDSIARAIAKQELIEKPNSVNVGSLNIKGTKLGNIQDTSDSDDSDLVKDDISKSPSISKSSLSKSSNNTSTYFTKKDLFTAYYEHQIQQHLTPHKSPSDTLNQESPLLRKKSSISLKQISVAQKSKINCWEKIALISISFLILILITIIILVIVYFPVRPYIHQVYIKVEYFTLSTLQGTVDLSLLVEYSVYNPNRISVRLYNFTLFIMYNDTTVGEAAYTPSEYLGSSVTESPMFCVNITSAPSTVIQAIGYDIISTGRVLLEAQLVTRIEYLQIIPFTFDQIDEQYILPTITDLSPHTWR